MPEKQKSKVAPTRRRRRSREEKVDASVEMTFPASDAPAPGHATGNEPPARPPDRKAPIITKEQIEAAAKDGHAVENHGGAAPKRRQARR
jgi:hypothetical protein